MRVGLDFDNTIVSYDSLFHKVAAEQGHIENEFGQSKIAVRDRLRADGKEAVWVEMQGYVYGYRMMEAEPYPHAVDFIRASEQGKNIVTTIVSHKTRYPFSGPKYDLHEAARNWIKTYLVDGEDPILPTNRVFFELTKDEKLKRIASCKFDIFVDDLPEILTHSLFPTETLAVLFDPSGQERVPPNAKRVRSWAELRELVHTHAT